jgi:hypothetical protein
LGVLNQESLHGAFPLEIDAEYLSRRSGRSGSQAPNINDPS